MGWRSVVITGHAKLDYQMGFLVVRKDSVTKIHINEISLLLVESTAVSLTAALLCELNKHKVKIIFCDEKRNPHSEVVPYYGAHDSSGKIRQQIQWSEEIKKTIWTEIVQEKINKQAELLEFYHPKEAAMLRSYIEEIMFGDESNREGHAAKVYFNALFGMDFTRTTDNSINAALNYGYSIVLSCVSREITSNGYLTQLGIFHDNMFNHFNLASDLMEPFRPIVDKIVLDMKPDKFEKEEKQQILSELLKTVIIGGRSENIDNAIKIYTRSIFDALNDADPSLIQFYRNEL